eukprot:6084270-Pyramimonas_sp.AAC.1
MACFGNLHGLSDGGFVAIVPRLPRVPPFQRMDLSHVNQKMQFRSDLPKYCLTVQRRCCPE